MKTPRDITGAELAKALRKFGYGLNRQVGSHMMLETELEGQHLIVVPNHNPIKVGTLNGIIGDVAEHFNMTKEEVILKLFYK
jgi:predicted RNA binding protein YcfA (HicA-like mRNA interferase family)